MSLLPLKDLLNAAVKRNGLTSNLSALQVCEAFNLLLRQTLGERLATEAKAVSFQHGQLVISVRHSIMIQEMRFKQSELLSLMQKRHPDIGLKELNIRLTLDKDFF